MHPDAIYRVNIDNGEDRLADMAISYVFSPPQDGRQTFSVFMATGEEARSVEAVGQKVVTDAEVSFGTTANRVTSGPYTFFAGSRSDAFFFDYDGIKNLFDTRLVHADRAGHPSVSSFFNTDETKEEYNAGEPVNDRKRWTDRFVHVMGHTGNYTRQEALAAIDADRILPDMLAFDPSKPAISQRSCRHRRRHQLPSLLPLEGRHPTHRARAAHRPSARVPLPRKPAPQRELIPRHSKGG
ncbi:hypothetical protein ACWIG5_28445 [Streptomyces lydicus]